MRRSTFLVTIALITGLTMIISYVLNPNNPRIGPAATSVKQVANIWSIIILAMTMILAAGSMLRLHTQRIRRREAGWAYSLITVISLLAGMVIFLGWNVQLGLKPRGIVARWTFDFIYNPLDATMFSLLAFFIASAAFRAFRARNIEAALMLLTAIIVMLGRVPLGNLISPYLPSLANWILYNPNLAAQRGLYIGVALGQVIMSLKIIFGVERPYMAGGR